MTARSSEIEATTTSALASSSSSSVDVPALVRPCLQQIVSGLSGYGKHAKVAEDVRVLVDRLDGLLVTGGGDSRSG